MARSKSNASDPFSAALRLLTRRDRSEAELRQKLLQFGFAVTAIDETVTKCREYGYLDDERYALNRARSLMSSGRGVGRKVRQDLYQRGLCENIVDKTLNALEEELSPTRILEQQLVRRFPDFNYANADQRERRRVVGYFQRRGFALDQIFAVLKP